MCARRFSRASDTPRNRTLIARTKGAALKYRNVGVRIEDDYVLTKDGLKRITDVPREMSEIEALRKKAVVQ